jgi:hypothetical protein
MDARQDVAMEHIPSRCAELLTPFLERGEGGMGKEGESGRGKWIGVCGF